MLAFAGLALAQVRDGGALEPLDQAGDGRAAPSVDELAKAALEQAPTISALRSRLKAANERITAADAFPDPTLEVVLQEVGVYRFDPASNFLVEYRQELPYPGKRQTRRQSAAAESTMRETELEDLRRRIVQQVKMLYAQVYALDNERRALKSAGELLELLSSAVSARYRAGQADQEALLKIQIEGARIGERLTDVESERAAWTAALNRLLDAPDESELGTIADLPDTRPPEGPLAELARKNSADIVMKQAYLRWTESRVEEARLDQKPDFMLGGGAGMDAMPQPMVMLRFGIQLPVWSGSKQEPLARSASHEREAARQDLRDAEAMARAEAVRLQTQWKRDEKLILQYKDTIIPQSLAALEAARADYLSGRGDFSTVVEDFSKWLEATTQLARREAGRFTTWADIERLAVPMAEREKEVGP